MLSGSETQRTRDLRAVLDLVRTGKATTRGEIIEHLNLRSTTVSELVGELVETDLLRESVVKQRGRGRPAAFLTYNTQRFGVVFMQVASRSIVARAVDMAGRVVGETHAAPPAETANDEMAAVLLTLAAEALQRFPAGVEVVAVVCSFSGLLDAPRRLWCFSSRWPNVSNLDVGEVLRGLGKEVVLVRNLDAELAGRLADADERREESVLLLHWGYGIGAAYSTERHDRESPARPVLRDRPLGSRQCSRLPDAPAATPTAWKRWRRSGRSARRSRPSIRTCR